VEEVGKVSVWTRQWWRWYDIKVAQRRSRHAVWTQRRSTRRSMRHRRGPDGGGGDEEWVCGTEDSNGGWRREMVVEK
jgi:hypothetical protein